MCEIKKGVSKIVAALDAKIERILKMTGQMKDKRKKLEERSGIVVRIRKSGLNSPAFVSDERIRSNSPHYLVEKPEISHKIFKIRRKSLPFRKKLTSSLSGRLKDNLRNSPGLIVCSSRIC